MVEQIMESKCSEQLCFVSDQEKVLDFYANRLGFQKLVDYNGLLVRSRNLSSSISRSPYRRSDLLLYR
jgi:hypothetical protein